MEEILREDPPAIDCSVPLEVIFTGEGAQDYGGPRQEFLGMVMREIRDKLFKEKGGGYIIFEKKEALDRKQYYGAALVFGKHAMPTETHQCHLHLAKKKLNLPFYCRFQFVARWSSA